MTVKGLQNGAIVGTCMFWSYGLFKEHGNFFNSDGFWAGLLMWFPFLFASSFGEGKTGMLVARTGKDERAAAAPTNSIDRIAAAPAKEDA